MIRAVHIEDEPGNIELLESLVTKHCADIISLEGNARNIRDAITLIQNKKPQLVFLDIELNQGNAFELLEQLKPVNFEVIFITAFNEYAVKAFRTNAVDYLLKPISTTELKEAVEKAVKRIATAKPENAAVIGLLKQIRADSNILKVGIPINDGMVFTNPDEIIRIEAKGSYSLLYLYSGKTLLSTRNLKFFEQQLPADIFLRVHHSWIIHLKYLKKYHRGKNGHMEMEDGSKVAVSLRKKGKFLKLNDGESIVNGE